MFCNMCYLLKIGVYHLKLIEQESVVKNSLFFLDLDIVHHEYEYIYIYVYIQNTVQLSITV